ncbi:hypothetical protein AQUCO_02600135v1 [Aquilegia coerulea]|uniref:F-box domain-containing protein n=1 Tax=Aquilegia coerulea TaxID=218851 RepID=A0A2G5D8D4_AQUCA|nr:hypothetical protein AQUCO_02600135v1 [Aquilegia coerulea]
MGINLPDEIILEIILCLPIKSLMRFRCVNKTWLQLFTTDPQFAQLYLNKSNRKNTTILAIRYELQQFQHKPLVYSSAVNIRSECDKVAVPLELPFYRGGTYSYLIGGIRNGLVLVNLDDDKKKLFIWNPLTNDYIDIPYPPTTNHFPRCDEIRGFGFGLIQATNQYKVIRFCDCKYRHFDEGVKKSHVSVYTLGIDSSWRNLKDISYYSIFRDCTAPLVNGVIHWNAFTGSNFIDDKRILSFDMKDEIFGEIPHPKHINANYPESFYDSVGELDGLLCMLGRDCGENIQVWVMQEYGVANSWTKQFTIGRPDICGSFTTLQPIIVPQKEKTLPKTSILIDTITPLQLILYDPETNSVTNLKEFGLHLKEAFNYTPSLISPRVISGNGDLLAVRRKASTPKSHLTWSYQWSYDSLFCDNKYT